MKHLLLVLFLCLGFAFQGEAQEIIIRSQDSVAVFNPQTFQTEQTRIEVVLMNSKQVWNEDGSSGSWQYTAYLQTENGTGVAVHTLSSSIGLLDLTNQGTSVHDYIRDEIYNAVIGVDPFGLTVWNKLY